MKLSTITLGFLALATLGGSALAAPPDVQRRQVELKSALAPFEFDLTGERTMTTRHGRRDMVMISQRDRAGMVEELKTAFRQKVQLPNGYRVIGWAHLVATDSYAFTIRNEARNEHQVVELFDDAAGTRVKIWGRVTQPGRQPLPDIRVPSRFSPTGLDPIVR